MKVGFNETSYTLGEAEGYVEVCVNATSPGTAAEFNIISTTGTLLKKGVLTTPLGVSTGMC